MPLFDLSDLDGSDVANVKITGCLSHSHVDQETDLEMKSKSLLVTNEGNAAVEYYKSMVATSSRHGPFDSEHVEVG